MIDIDEWLRELDEGEDLEAKSSAEYQKELFSEYVMRGHDHMEERKQLARRFQDGEPVWGKKA